MIFLRRAKKYITKKLDDITFYDDISDTVIINSVLYGGVVNNGGQFEYFVNVTQDALCEFWCEYDDTIINDEETYSHKFVRIFKSEKRFEYFKHEQKYDAIYFGCPGFYYFNNKTLYRYHLGVNDADIIEIFISKIRISKIR